MTIVIGLACIAIVMIFAYCFGAAFGAIVSTLQDERDLHYATSVSDDEFLGDTITAEDLELDRRGKS